MELKGEEVKLTPLDYADQDKLQLAATLSYSFNMYNNIQVARWWSCKEFIRYSTVNCSAVFSADSCNFLKS